MSSSSGPMLFHPRLGVSLGDLLSLSLAASCCGVEDDQLGQRLLSLIQHVEQRRALHLGPEISRRPTPSSVHMCTS